MLIGAVVQYFFGISIFVTSIFLILLVLVQRGRGGGLTGALGGPGGQSAFGTKAGDLFTRITIGVAAAWIFLCASAVYFLRPSALPDIGGSSAKASATSGMGSVDEPALDTGTGLLGDMTLGSSTGDTSMLDLGALNSDTAQPAVTADPAGTTEQSGEITGQEAVAGPKDAVAEESLNGDAGTGNIPGGDPETKKPE